MTVAALELRGVEKRFGATEIVRGVDLRVEKGERHALIGPNGAGKSVLFNLISALFPLSSGSIALHVTANLPFASSSAAIFTSSK